MSTALWVTLIFSALVWTLTLRATVRLACKGADNGWDNALAYLLASGGLLLGARWLAGELGLSWLLIAPALILGGQLIALRVIYEVRLLRAAFLALLHGLLAGAALTLIATLLGAIAALILYGKIIADPWFLIRLLLRLIGLELT